mmetsp:Transcript_15615/g.33971  ORF Transcript_15615/g.33971 Transcript_15615/m.33971 type:complete len:102 (+) Transcript_15615:148-453(+)
MLECDCGRLLHIDVNAVVTAVALASEVRAVRMTMSREAKQPDGGGRSDAEKDEVAPTRRLLFVVTSDDSIAAKRKASEGRRDETNGYWRWQDGRAGGMAST